MKRSRFVRGDQTLEIPLLQPLFDDIVECEELLDRSDTQFARRTLVRAAFAFNEGFVYWLKDHVEDWLLTKAGRTQNLEVSKLLLLSDDVYRPTRQGKMESQPNRIPFLNFCAFVIRTGAECWDLDPGPLFSDNGWKDMQDAIYVRDRITHPKRHEDLDITDKELCSVSEGHRWLFNCVVDVVNSAQMRFDSQDP